VSALIHAATMVTAGVYLLARMNPVLELSSSGRWAVALIGMATAFVAATIACAQQDIKKVLAFSTVSQIGYMVMAVGVRAYVAAIFLMVCHAFYKALLFLGAGSVIHGLDDEQDLKRMGALRRYMKWTTITFTVGWLTIAGIPPLSAFFSKGDVLDNVWSFSKVMYLVAALTAILTAYYMSRLYFLAFGSGENWREAGHHAPHESPWIMLAPLWILAVLSAAGGLLDLPGVAHHSLSAWLDPVFGHDLRNPMESTSLKWALAGVDAVLAASGIAIAWGIWRNRVDDPALEPQFLQQVWYWDDAYNRVFGIPGQALSRFCAVVIDNKIIDGAVNGVGTLVRSTGSGARRLQTGYVRNYALGITLGLAAIAAFLVSRIWWS
jgi:NADH-quinone oxidoreductase subunit L